VRNKCNSTSNKRILCQHHLQFPLDSTTSDSTIYSGFPPSYRFKNCESRQIGKIFANYQSLKKELNEKEKLHHCNDNFDQGDDSCGSLCEY
jgi:hypothetical protein